MVELRWYVTLDKRILQYRQQYNPTVRAQTLNLGAFVAELAIAPEPQTKWSDWRDVPIVLDAEMIESGEETKNRPYTKE